MTCFATVDIDLESLAERAGRELEFAPAEEIVRWAVAMFGHRLAVAASMQDTTMSHLVGSALPGVDVLFLDTGYHFPRRCRRATGCPGCCRSPWST